MTRPASPKVPVTRTADVTCLGCGCLCDDIIVKARGEAILATTHACPRGEQWFARKTPTSGPYFQQGLPVSRDEALHAAQQILTASRVPLIVLGSSLSCEGAQRAAALADRIGATVSPATSHSRLFPEQGLSTCTWGEIATRGDLILFWMIDPQELQPRLLERFCRKKVPIRNKNGRRRKLVGVSSFELFGKLAFAAFDDVMIAHADITTVVIVGVLRMVLKGVELDENDVLKSTGLSLQFWQELIESLRNARYGVICSTEEHLAPLAPVIREINRQTRCVAWPLAGPGNPTGVADVLTWQTGLTGAIDFGPGYPQPLAHFDWRTQIESGELDCLVTIGLSEEEAAQVSPVRAPWISLGENGAALNAQVAIQTASLGISEGGTVIRGDHVALPLRPVYPPTLPLLVELLEALTPQLAPIEEPTP